MAKKLERWQAEAEANRLMRETGKLYRARKDGPIYAPYWKVEEVK